MSTPENSIDYAIKEKILSTIRKYPISSICDYGCGTGTLLKSIKNNANKDVFLAGIDYFSRFQENERPTDEDHITYIDRGKNLYQEFLINNKNKFDLLISTFALHHFRFPILELKNIDNLIKKDGYLLIVDIDFKNENDAEITKNLRSYIDEVYSAFKGHYHRHHYKLEEVTDLLRSIDVDIIEASSFRIEETEQERLEQAKSDLKHIEHIKPKINEFKNKILEEYFNISYDLAIKRLNENPPDYSSTIWILAKKN